MVVLTDDPPFVVQVALDYRDFAVLVVPLPIVGTFNDVLFIVEADKTLI